MNDKLIEELYETADRYFGRMNELCMLAIATIQRQEQIIKKLTETKNKEED